MLRTLHFTEGLEGDHDFQLLHRHLQALLTRKETNGFVAYKPEPRIDAQIWMQWIDDYVEKNKLDFSSMNSYMGLDPGKILDLSREVNDRIDLSDSARRACIDSIVSYITSEIITSLKTLPLGKDFVFLSERIVKAREIINTKHIDHLWKHKTNKLKAWFKIQEPVLPNRVFGEASGHVETQSLDLSQCLTLYIKILNIIKIARGLQYSGTFQTHGPDRKWSPEIRRLLLKSKYHIDDSDMPEEAREIMEGPLISVEREPFGYSLFDVNNLVSLKKENHFAEVSSTQFHMDRYVVFMKPKNSLEFFNASVNDLENFTRLLEDNEEDTMMPFIEHLYYYSDAFDVVYSQILWKLRKFYDQGSSVSREFSDVVEEFSRVTGKFQAMLRKLGAQSKERQNWIAKSRAIISLKHVAKLWKTVEDHPAKDRLKQDVRFLVLDLLKSFIGTEFIVLLSSQ